jgi:hypothetical protein
MNNMITFKTLLAKTKWIKLALIVCLLNSMSITGFAQAKVNQLSAIQYSRVDISGKMLFANSSLAALRFNAVPDATETYYLNIVAKGINREDIWVVRNFPIFSRKDNYSENFRQLELDLKYLNIRPGQTVRSVQLSAVVTLDIATRMPVGSFSTVAVTPATLRNETADGYDETNSYAGYVGMVAPAGVTIHNDSFPSVQEHYWGCTPGSFARSIAWLNKKYNLGCSLSAQDLYNNLRHKIFFSGPVSYDSAVARKARLLDSIAKAGGKRGKTEFMDRDNSLGNIGNITTVTNDTAVVIVKDPFFIDHINNDANVFETDATAMTTSTPSSSSGNLGEVSVSDPATWLKDNLAGNDVELNLTGNGLTHMITVTGITCTGGVCTITYRDDEHQDSTAGDTAEKTAEIKGDSIKFNGTWYKISVLFKESITAAANRMAVVMAPEAELLPNRPNPFSGSTTIGIRVKKAFPYEHAELVIRDMNGGLVQRIKLKLQVGLNEVQYNLRRGEKGALVYTLEVDGKPLQSRQMQAQQEP